MSFAHLLIASDRPSCTFGIAFASASAPIDRERQVSFLVSKVFCVIFQFSCGRRFEKMKLFASQIVKDHSKLNKTSTLNPS